MSEPRMRQNIEGEHGYIETWWTKRVPTERGAIAIPLKSDNLAPVRLPVGQESALCEAIRRLPAKKAGQP